MSPIARQKDRRRINVAVPVERRRKGGQGAQDRRRCPSCDGTLNQVVRSLKGGTVTASTCPACGWTNSSRQADVDVLVLKMDWPLMLESRDGALAAVLPPELSAALKAKAGDAWILSPLTSPLGSQAMQWTLRIKKIRA